MAEWYPLYEKLVNASLEERKVLFKDLTMDEFETLRDVLNFSKGTSKKRILQELDGIAEVREKLSK